MHPSSSRNTSPGPTHIAATHARGAFLCYQDITLKGLSTLQKCSEVYLEAYTSILTVDKDRLERAYGVNIQVISQFAATLPLISCGSSLPIANGGSAKPQARTLTTDRRAAPLQRGTPTHPHNIPAFSSSGHRPWHHIKNPVSAMICYDLQ